MLGHQNASQQSTVSSIFATARFDQQSHRMEENSENGSPPRSKIAGDAGMSRSATENVLRQQILAQRIKNQAQKLQKDVIEQLSSELEQLLQGFVTEVEHLEHNGDANDNYTSFPSKAEKKRHKGDLPDKVFHMRRSMLTELFEINHIRTIYHIFVAILIVFSLNTFVYDLVNEGRLNLDFRLMQWALGKFPKVMALWVCMQISTLIIVYPMFYYWVVTRLPGPVNKTDLVALCLFVVYQIAFVVLPVYYIREHQLPPASAVIITTEQVRLIMKVHAFVRENIPRVLANYKKDDGDVEVRSNLCPDFSKYLYFLFAPTLVYRDSYPRTKTIRWNYVVTNFAQVLACLLYTYYIFERFCVPYFNNFNKDHVTPKALLLSVFGCMLPGTLVLFIAFFAILHSWLNAFAEMLKFGDRMFYKDWWNSTTFANYYRTWNIVVHDWLYTYIYKDCNRLLGAKNRAGAMALVFLISAVVHEYILTICFSFFYPVLFVMFMGAGFSFIFVTDKGVSRSWNVFLWVALFIGNGLLMCLYSMEWYARINCPVNTDNFLDYIIPRSWTCMI
ncbi:sterol O-acyltransferase 1-like isoform X2 [Pecten maximus]|uniref:sterol O-acyltransferase 1-like isoform X2 n=1 Tax=Pecten maximus TaxID=6579 RepID=UPI0014584964|nr:sterol O-acyltransferase 1-like isoform X2 [Pecten maximus]